MLTQSTFRAATGHGANNAQHQPISAILGKFKQHSIDSVTA